MINLNHTHIIPMQLKIIFNYQSDWNLHHPKKDHFSTDYETIIIIISISILIYNFLSLFVAKLGKSFLSIIYNLEKDMKIDDYAYNETTNFMVVVSIQSII